MFFFQETLQILNFYLGLKGLRHLLLLNMLLSEMYQWKPVITHSNRIIEESLIKGQLKVQGYEEHKSMCSSLRLAIGWDPLSTPGHNKGEGCLTRARIFTRETQSTHSDPTGRELKEQYPPHSLLAYRSPAGAFHWPNPTEAKRQESPLISQ